MGFQPHCAFGSPTWKVFSPHHYSHIATTKTARIRDSEETLAQRVLGICFVDTCLECDGSSELHTEGGTTNGETHIRNACHKDDLWVKPCAIIKNFSYLEDNAEFYGDLSTQASAPAAQAGRRYGRARVYVSFDVALPSVVPAPSKHPVLQANKARCYGIWCWSCWCWCIGCRGDWMVFICAFHFLSIFVVFGMRVEKIWKISTGRRSFVAAAAAKVERTVFVTTHG